MSNMILLRRDSYLDFVKLGVKQHTMNSLRNAPMFGYALFPEAAIMMAEQDIQKAESSSVAQGPGPGALRHTSWRGSHRYKSYDHRDRKPSASAEQVSQSQQQPWHQFSSHRSRGRGRGRGSNPRFSKAQSYKQFKWQLLCGFQNPWCKISQKWPKVLQNSVVKQTVSKVGCILSCCFSCSFCTFTRAAAKERSKTRSLSEQNKACQRCMLCKSLPFCPLCSKCPQCCVRTECRGKITKLLASLVNHGCESAGSLYPQGRLHDPFKTKTAVDTFSLGPKRRPILDLSQLNLFVHTGTFKMETPETIRLSQKTGSGSLRWTSATHISTCQLPKGQGNISGSSCSIRLFSSQVFPLVWPQLHWSSPRWSKRWNPWLKRRVSGSTST